jgi:hypothetical protein
MLKKFLAASAAVLVAGSVAYAAQIPLITGAQDPSQLNATINSVIQAVNAGTGLAGYVGGLPLATTGTTIQTLGSITLPAGQLKSVGQGVRIVCYGNGTATGTNTMTVQVGTATAYAVAGAGTTAGVYQTIVTVYKSGANTQQILSSGSFNTTLTLPTIISATQTDTAAITITCSGTSTTSTNFTLDGMFVTTLQ